MAPSAAGFRFLSKYFYTSWGMSGGSDLILQQYINTSCDEPGIDRAKVIRITDRTDLFKVTTHRIIPLKEFISYDVPAEEAYLRHYRTCMRINIYNNMTRDDCMYNTERVQDTTVAQWSMRIADNVRRVRNDIFGEDPEENIYLDEYVKLANWD